MQNAMFRPPSLAAVVTAARAGAIDHAKALFEAGGYDRRSDDPAALAVAGRLLKDQALRLPPGERRSAFYASADAYARADQLLPQPYTRINQATLTLLGGERDRASHLAREILDWLDQGTAIPETPYFIAAIRAEAQLICGDLAGAHRALDEAMATDTGDWSDRASTLRQLRLILGVIGEDAGWLDQYAAPRSLHFAGHLGISVEDAGPLRAAIDAELAARNIGFGFGALAAGADIIIAEQLLAWGGELHVVLPTSADEFSRQSVKPYGADWLQRFDTCLDAAATVTETAHVTGDYEPLATLLASEVAMGAACRNARYVDSEAVQLVVVDEGAGPYGDGTGTAVVAERWAATGRQQAVLRCPRSATVVASGRRPDLEGRTDRRLVALLQISFAGIDDLDEARFAEAVDSVLTPFRKATAALAVQPLMTLPVGNARIVAFATTEAAWTYAAGLLALPPTILPLCIAGHYGLAHWFEHPSALVGRAVSQLGDLFASAMPGVLTVSEAFASALFVGCNEEIFAEWIGEVKDLRLYTVCPVRAGSA